MGSEAGLIRYLIKAFLFRWNLLFLFAGAAFGVIAGKGEIVFPLLAAGEVIFVSILGTNSAFQKSVDGGPEKELDNTPSFQTDRIIRELNFADVKRFRKLKEMCAQLLLITRQANMDSESELDRVTKVQMEGMNRLLWIYLKLLYSRNALDNYFNTVNREEIEAKIKLTKKRLSEENREAESPGGVKCRESLQDTLTTCQRRLDNFILAKENYKFLEVELERLYAKIAGLAEMGINRQDPNHILGEIDLASTSIEQTRDALNDMEFLTGISVSDDKTPFLLDEP